MDKCNQIEADLHQCNEVIKNANSLLLNCKNEVTQAKLQDVLNEIKIDMEDQLRRIQKKNFVNLIFEYISY